MSCPEFHMTIIDIMEYLFRSLKKSESLVLCDIFFCPLTIFSVQQWMTHTLTGNQLWHYDILENYSFFQGYLGWKNFGKKLWIFAIFPHKNTSGINVDLRYNFFKKLCKKSAKYKMQFLIKTLSKWNTCTIYLLIIIS